MSKFRLYSNDAFLRPEEENPHNPKAIMFLSVEGANTERQYFEQVGRHIKHSENTVFRVEVLKRKRSDGSSSPEYVIELLDEYVNVRDNKLLPEPWMERLKEKYSPEIIDRVLTRAPEATTSKEERKIYDELLIEGVHLQYRKYLKRITGESDKRDVVAAIIDRDGGDDGRSRETLEACIAECKTKSYKLYLTNPCFEFWLLLHLCDVRTDYADKMTDLLENKSLSNKHSFVSNEVSKLAQHSKGISQKKISDVYIPKIPQAKERAKAFAGELSDILDSLGTNLPELMTDLGL